MLTHPLSIGQSGITRWLPPPVSISPSPAPASGLVQPSMGGELGLGREVVAQEGGVVCVDTEQGEEGGRPGGWGEAAVMGGELTLRGRTNGYKREQWAKNKRNKKKQRKI